MIIVTTTSAGNLYKAKVMAKSAKTHMPEVKVVTCVIEKTLDLFETDKTSQKNIQQITELRKASFYKGFNYFDEVVLAKDMGIPHFEKLAFKHSVLELSCIMKYYTMEYAMEKYPDEDIFVYLDSDMMVYGSFIEILQKLQNFNIVLTPHRIDPDPWEHFLKDGTFNGGFFALKRSIDGENFLKWMISRLNVKNYIDEEQGLFVDQKWFNLAPAYFHVAILRHPGYNLAGWNLHESERKMIAKIGGVFRVKDQFLRLIHFSGIGIFFEKVLNDWFPTNKNHPLFTLLEEYMGEWEEMGIGVIKNTPWSYDFYYSGERISAEVRGKIKYNPHLLDQYLDPFAMSNQDFK